MKKKLSMRDRWIYANADLRTANVVKNAPNLIFDFKCLGLGCSLFPATEGSWLVSGVKRIIQEEGQLKRVRPTILAPGQP